MSALDREVWRGRIDAEDGEAGRRWHQVVQIEAPRLNAGVALIGFACDAGVVRNRGRRGAAEGPRALRRMLAGLAYHPSRRVPLIDAGDVSCSGDALEDAQRELAHRIAALRAAGHFPMVLGGGHELAWGSFQGLMAAGERAPSSIGIINFDAHFDLRRPHEGGRGTSGTSFFQIAEALAARGMPFRYLCLGISAASNTPALFAAARERNAVWLHDYELIWSELPRVRAIIEEFIDSVATLQLSICLDVFSGSVAPGVSAPAGRGIAVDLAFELLSIVLRRAGHGSPDSKLLLAEIAELNPRLDRDDLTARLASDIVYDVCTPLL